MHRTQSSHSREALASARALLAVPSPNTRAEQARTTQPGADADPPPEREAITVPATGAKPAARPSPARPVLGQMLVPRHFPRHARVVSEINVGLAPAATAGGPGIRPDWIALPHLLRVGLRAPAASSGPASGSPAAPALAVRPVAVAPSAAPATGNVPGTSAESGEAWSAPPLPDAPAPHRPIPPSRPPKRGRGEGEGEGDAEASASASTAAGVPRHPDTGSAADAEDRPVRQRR